MSTITPTNFWASQTIYTSQDPGKVSPNAGDPEFTKAPANLAADTFRSWTREKQLAYLDKNGGAATIGPEKGEQIKVKVADQLAVEFTVPNGTSNGRTEITSDEPGYYAQRVGELDKNGVRQTADFDKDADKLDPRIFMSWRVEDQREYLSKKGVTTAGGELLIGVAGSDMGSVRAKLVKDVAITGDLLYFAGNADDIPYTKLPGSAGGVSSLSLMPSPFPTVDGSSATLSADRRPDGFETDWKTLTTEASQKDFLARFSNWHSAYQLEYVKSNGSTNTSGAKYIQIPVGSTTPLMTAVASKTDPTMIYIVEALDKAAFAKMSKDDQDAMASTVSFLNIASKVGLRDVDDATVANLGSATNPTGLVKPTEAVQNLIIYMDTKLCSNAPSTVIPPAISSLQVRTATSEEQAAGISYREVSRGGTPVSYNYEKLQAQKLPDTDRGYFTSQLKLLTEQLSGMGVVSPAELTKKLTDLKDRFDRAFAFFDVKAPYKIEPFMGGDPNNNNDVNNTKATAYVDVISLDNNETINKGYRVFIAQEKRISELAEERMKLVRNDGTLFGKKLDVPELVYRFQSLYNLQLEAQVVMETEEVNQQNALLKIYAKMQDVVNRTLSTFSKAEGDRYVLNLSVDDMGDKANKLSNEERLIISMFEDRLGTGQKHPLETLRKIDRPREDIIYQPGGALYGNQSNNSNYDLVGRSHMQWSGFGTRLSEAVTIINQNSQIKMNDINSMDKQRNRHFELANSALSKMSEMVNNIARAG